MSARTTAAFGEVLRQHRLAAGLTQEALAERAGVSPRGIQNLERGENRPLRDTARRLVEALGLDERERALVLTAAGRRPGAAAAPPSHAEQAVPQSPAAPRHNLPSTLSSFIGRERERVRVSNLLAAHRLVTLTGSGGVGKTRLALAAAEGSLDSYPDGVWLVELAPLTDPALIPAVLAQVLGPREERGRPLLATLTDHLKDRRPLLVLDNCEHLVAACADLVTALLRGCPTLRLLATSRQGLRVAGEQRYRVPSLSAPDPKHPPPPELLGSYEAVRLFVERAREQREDFALTPSNARAVTEICARLDGVPLAIELAAARAGSTGVATIAARLDERFRLLTGGAHDLPSRQRTLRAALDWSWELLREEERMLLARLSVFSGGWTLEAAEAVCGGDDHDPWLVLDALDALVGKSLVQVDETDEGAGRYGLLETVRQYAAERLGERGEGAVIRGRHLGWYLALARKAAPHLTSRERGAWVARLAPEHDNLRAALGWARDSEAAEEGLELAGALWPFWDTQGYVSDGRAWLEGALTAGAGGSPAARARVLDGAGILAERQGEYQTAVARHEEALALRRTLGDRQGIAKSLNNLGIVAEQQGEYSRATALYEETLALRRALGDQQGIVLSLRNLGNVAYEEGEYRRATALHEENLALCREAGDRQGCAASLNTLGLVAYREGDYGRAADLLEEALALWRAAGHSWGLAPTLDSLGLVALAQGNYQRAAASHVESLTLAARMGEKRGVAYGLEGLARVAADPANPACDPRRATRLLAAAAALRAGIGAPLPPAERPPVERAREEALAALGEPMFAIAWADGWALPLEEAVALAMEGHAVVE